jgi:glycosyltransferase involved in cell wall biosynthesis
MMVKDEEKNIRRCLDALRPILEKPDIELIIIDTGSQDRTADIAREYTDRVYSHPWNNQFSEMRNTSISYAKGRYIFILDADEVAQDSSELYEIINDKRLSSYNTFLVKIKNLSSNGMHTTINQERVFKNDGDFHYEGAVHNQPVFKGPVLATDITLVHYGYLFNDNELKEKKFIRTSTLLKEELLKNPENSYYRFQLARSYLAHGDMKEALAEIRKAYQLISGHQEEKKSRISILGTYAVFCFACNEFNEAICICREGIKIKPDYLDMYYILAMCLLHFEEKNEALDAYIKYIDLVDRFNDLDISFSRSVEMYYLNQNSQDDARCYIAEEFMKQGKEEAYQYIDKISDKKRRVILSVKAFIELGKLDALKDLYMESEKDKFIAESIINTIESEKTKLTAEKKKDIESLFCEGEDLYSLLNRVRLNKAGDNHWITGKALKESDLNRLPHFYADLFLGIDKNTRPIISIFKKLTKTKLKQYINILIEGKSELKDFFEGYLNNVSMREDDFDGLKVCICIAHVLLSFEAMIIKNLDDIASEQYYSFFKQYVQFGVKYTALLYKQERLRLYYNTIEDQEDRFFIAINYALEAIDKGEYGAGIRYYRVAARSNPIMALYLNMYKDELLPRQVTGDIEEEGHE